MRTVGGVVQGIETRHDIALHLSNDLNELWWAGWASGRAGTRFRAISGERGRHGGAGGNEGWRFEIAGKNEEGGDKLYKNSHQDRQPTRGAYADDVVADLTVAKHLLQAVWNESVCRASVVVLV